MSTVFDIFNQHAQEMSAPRQTYAQNFFEQLRSFASTFSGNPELIVRNMLANGQMSRDQFNQLSQQASQIQKMMKLH